MVIDEKTPAAGGPKPGQQNRLSSFSHESPYLSNTISVFKGAKAPKPFQETTWQQALKQIREGKYKAEIERLRALNDVEYKREKPKLPGITFCGNFEYRKISRLKAATGFILADVDHVNDVDSAFDLLCRDENVWFAFRSPSNKGVKVGLRAGNIYSDKDIKRFFWAIERYFNEIYCIEIDSSCKDVSRLTFYSYDPDLFINSNPCLFEVATWTDACDPQSKTIGINPSSCNTAGKVKYAWKVLESCCNAIRKSKPGNMHSTRLKKARLAGGYIHYLDENTVYAALKDAVVQSRTTDARKALQTIEDGLEYGKMNPIEIPVQERNVTSKANPAKTQKKDKKHAKPSHVLQQLNDAGYHFRMNTANDTLECNGEPLTDSIAAGIRFYAKEHNLGIYSVQGLHDIMVKSGQDNAYHPVKGYLSGLQWDGQDHISALAAKMVSPDPPIIYPDNTTKPPHELYLQKFLVGAVAKAIAGEQNAALVFEGPQGCGKSRFAKWLCSGLPNYFVEAPLYGQDKDLDMNLISHFIWEISEMDATAKKKDVAAVKGFVSKGTVTVRPSYGRFYLKKPALASFIGTVNPGTGFLSDESGNRRFLCVRVSSMDWSYSTDINVNQVWAQVVALYQEGYDWNLSGAEKHFQTENNKSFNVESPVEDFIQKHFIVTDDPDDVTLTIDIISLLRESGFSVGTDRQAAMEIGKAMTNFGAVYRTNERPRGYRCIRLNNHAGCQPSNQPYQPPEKVGSE